MSAFRQAESSKGNLDSESGADAGTSHREHMKPVLWDVSHLSVKLQVHFTVAVLTFKGAT